MADVTVQQPSRPDEPLVVGNFSFHAHRDGVEVRPAHRIASDAAALMVAAVAASAVLASLLIADGAGPTTLARYCGVLLLCSFAVVRANVANTSKIRIGLRPGGVRVSVAGGETVVFWPKFSHFAARQAGWQGRDSLFLITVDGEAVPVGSATAFAVDETADGLDVLNRISAQWREASTHTG